MGHTNSITVSRAYIIIITIIIRTTTHKVLATFRIFLKFSEAASGFHSNTSSLCRLLATQQTPCQEKQNLTWRFTALGDCLHHA